jgi:hypothetical protein
MEEIQSNHPLKFLPIFDVIYIYIYYIFIYRLLLLFNNRFILIGTNILNLATNKSKYQ